MMACFGGINDTFSQPEDVLAGYQVSNAWAWEQMSPSTASATMELNDLVLDQRGTLWLATRIGLFLKSGDSFLRFAPERFGFGTNRVSHVLADSLNNVYIMTELGELGFVSGGRLVRLTNVQGELALSKIWPTRFELVEGSIWTSTQDGVVRLDQDRVVTINDHPGLRDARAIWARSPAWYYAVSNEGLFEVRDGQVRKLLNNRDALISGRVLVGVAAVDRSETLLLMTQGTPVLFEPARGEVAQVLSSIQGPGRSIHRTTDGSIVFSTYNSALYLWDGSPSIEEIMSAGRGNPTLRWTERWDEATWRGLVRLSSTLVSDVERSSRPEVIGSEGEVSRGPIVHVDGRGSIWLGAERGLLQMSARRPGMRWSAVGANIYPVVETSEEEIIFGRWDRRQWVQTTSGNFLSFSDRKSDPFGFPVSLEIDAQRRLWGAGGAVRVMDLDRRLPLTLASPTELDTDARAVLSLPDGSMWIAFESDVWRLSNFQQDGGILGADWTRVSLDSTRLETAGFNRFMVQLQDGNIVLGRFGSPLSIYVADRAQFEPLVPGALRNARDLWQDREGYAWVVGDTGGICRLSMGYAGRKPKGDTPDITTDLYCISDEHGVESDLTRHRIISPDGEHLFVNTNRGIYLYRRDDLMQATNDPGHRVVGILLSRYFEVPLEGNGGVQQAGLLTKRGQIVFPTTSGLITIDPDTILKTLALDVYQDVRALSHTALNGRVELPSTHDPLRVFVQSHAPVYQKDLIVQYRVRPTGTGWQTVPSSHVLELISLGPRESVLEIRSGLLGSWSDTYRLTLYRAPFWFESYVIWIIIILGVVFLGFLVSSTREREISRSLTLERTRRDRLARAYERSQELTPVALMETPQTLSADLQLLAAGNEDGESKSIINPAAMVMLQAQALEQAIQQGLVKRQWLQVNLKAFFETTFQLNPVVQTVDPTAEGMVDISAFRIGLRHLNDVLHRESTAITLAIHDETGPSQGSRSIMITWIDGPNDMPSDEGDTFDWVQADAQTQRALRLIAFAGARPLLNVVEDQVTLRLSITTSPVADAVSHRPALTYPMVRVQLDCSDPSMVARAREVLQHDAIFYVEASDTLVDGQTSLSFDLRIKIRDHAVRRVVGVERPSSGPLVISIQGPPEELDALLKSALLDYSADIIGAVMDRSRSELLARLGEELVDRNASTLISSFRTILDDVESLTTLLRSQLDAGDHRAAIPTADRLQSVLSEYVVPDMGQKKPRFGEWLRDFAAYIQRVCQVDLNLDVRSDIPVSRAWLNYVRPVLALIFLHPKTVNASGNFYVTVDQSRNSFRVEGRYNTLSTSSKRLDWVASLTALVELIQGHLEVDQSSDDVRLSLVVPIPTPPETRKVYGLVEDATTWALAEDLDVDLRSFAYLGQVQIDPRAPSPVLMLDGSKIDGWPAVSIGQLRKALPGFTFGVVVDLDAEMLPRIIRLVHEDTNLILTRGEHWDWSEKINELALSDVIWSDSVSRFLDQYNYDAKYSRPLSAREWDILQHCVDGLPPKQIAEKLGIAASTVNVIRSNIASKLLSSDVSSWAQYLGPPRQASARSSSNSGATYRIVVWDYRLDRVASLERVLSGWAPVISFEVRSPTTEEVIRAEIEALSEEVVCLVGLDLDACSRWLQGDHSRAAQIILMLPSAPAEQTYRDAIRLGYRGIIATPEEVSFIREIVQQTSEGDPYVSAAIEMAWRREVLARADAHDLSQLSRRESDIVHLLHFGKSVAEVADETGLALSTVYTLRARAFAKLEIHDISALKLPPK